MKKTYEIIEPNGEVGCNNGNYYIIRFSNGAETTMCRCGCGCANTTPLAEIEAYASKA